MQELVHQKSFCGVSECFHDIQIAKQLSKYSSE